MLAVLATAGFKCFTPSVCTHLLLALGASGRPLLLGGETGQPSCCKGPALRLWRYLGGSRGLQQLPDAALVLLQQLPDGCTSLESNGLGPAGTSSWCLCCRGSLLWLCWFGGCCSGSRGSNLWLGGSSSLDGRSLCLVAWHL